MISMKLSSKLYFISLVVELDVGYEAAQFELWRDEGSPQKVSSYPPFYLISFHLHLYQISIFYFTWNHPFLLSKFRINVIIPQEKCYGLPRIVRSSCFYSISIHYSYH